MRDLSKVKGFSVLADLTLADSTAMHCQHLLNSLFSFFTLAFCFFPFSPLLSLPVFLKYSTSPFCYISPHFLEFVYCVLFPLSTVSMWHCTTFFPFNHVGYFSLLAAACLYPHMACATYVLPRQKASLLGLKPARLAPLFCLPQELSDSQLIDLLKNYNRVTQETVSRMLRSA